MENKVTKDSSAWRIVRNYLLIIACFLAGVGGSAVYDAADDRAAITLPPSYDGNAVITQEEEDVASVAAKVAPSVVSILTSSVRESGFYAQELQGAGTGVILSKDGYVMTNNHVVEGVQTVSVVQADGTIHEAVQVLGRDPLNDIAFLKIKNVSELPAVQLGDSKSVRIGQRVVAIGNALGQYQNTVTSGIISGVGRSVTAGSEGALEGETEELADLIQTDAAINSGNSGGPLVNMAGQVIGINTAIASDANSVGFVIPVSATRGMIDGLLRTGKVSRAYIGVQYIALSPSVAKTYQLPVTKGAYVYAERGAAVVPKGPAARAGIKAKDIIVQVNGIDVGEKGSVATLVGEYKPGDTIRVTILRGGKKQTLTIKLEAYQG